MKNFEGLNSIIVYCYRFLFFIVFLLYRIHIFCCNDSIPIVNSLFLYADVAGFKELARAATHTILAACGMEHQKKYGVHSFSNFECSHMGLCEIPRSDLMPTSCRHCFNSFVKDVVNSIMFAKIGRANMR